MRASTVFRPLCLAVMISAAVPVAVQSGDTPQMPPVFVPPPPGGLVDPVFTPPQQTPGSPALAPAQKPPTDPALAPAQNPAAGPVFAGPASPEATQSIVSRINAARDFCRRVPAQEYTIDCLGDALQTIAADIPADGDYGEAKEALADAAQKLRSLATSNASRELPRGTVRVQREGGRSSATPLTPVARETLAQSNAAAVSIIEEAETVLLRSAANSAARRVHYQQIATAVGSTKVLLRST
ncbi:MAG: hypothetical protein AAFY59_12910 [Pseudomonadota bacterium]